MIKVDSFTIYCEVEDIVNSLVAEGLLNPKTSSKGSYIMICCPFHNENNPSSSITTEDIIKTDKTIRIGTFHCFGCGEVANVFQLVSQCLGKHDGGFAGIKWIKDRFKVEENEASHVNIPTGLTSTRSRRNRHRAISEEVLDGYRYTHPYMYERHLEDEYIDFFDIGYDQDTDCLTFPVKDLQGRVCYITRRSVGKRRHVQETDGTKTDFIWGLYETLQELEYNPSQEVYICESVLNAVRYWQVGKVAVALMGTGGGNQDRLLSNIKCRTLVCSLDPDKAGISGTYKIHNNEWLRGKYISDIEYPQDVIDDGRDINDMTDDEILNLRYKWLTGYRTVSGEDIVDSNIK